MRIKNIFIWFLILFLLYLFSQNILGKCNLRSGFTSADDVPQNILTNININCAQGNPDLEAQTFYPLNPLDPNLTGSSEFGYANVTNG